MGADDREARAVAANDDAYADEVLADRAAQLCATDVPDLLIDDDYAIAGQHSLRQAIARRSRGRANAV